MRSKTLPKVKKFIFDKKRLKKVSNAIRDESSFVRFKIELKNCRKAFVIHVATFNSLKNLI